MKRTAFFISDGTGLTAEALGHSLLAQFEKIDFERITVPYIDDVAKARDMVKRINKAMETDGARPLVFDTIVNDDIRAVITVTSAGSRRSTSHWITTTGPGPAITMRPT